MTSLWRVLTTIHAALLVALLYFALESWNLPNLPSQHFKEAQSMMLGWTPSTTVFAKNIKAVSTVSTTRIAGFYTFHMIPRCELLSSALPHSKNDAFARHESRVPWQRKPLSELSPQRLGDVQGSDTLRRKRRQIRQRCVRHFKNLGSCAKCSKMFKARHSFAWGLLM